MSILPLLPANLGIDLFSMGITVRDVSLSVVEGEDVESLLENRIIQGAVDGRKRKIEHLFAGTVSSGGIAIFTYDFLFLGDIHEESDTPQQSYIIYSNFEYKVVELSDVTKQAGANIYLAERHVTQQGL